MGVALYLVLLVSDKLIFLSSVDVLGENWEEEYYFQTFFVLGYGELQHVGSQ